MDYQKTAGTPESEIDFWRLFCFSFKRAINDRPYGTMDGRP
jgi:hypothetical protein